MVLIFKKHQIKGKNVYWMVGICLDKKYKLTKNQLRKKLLKHNIDTRDFFMSIANQPCFLNIKKMKKHKTPISDKLWDNGLYLHQVIILLKKKLLKFVI